MVRGILLTRGQSTAFKTPKEKVKTMNMIIEVAAVAGIAIAAGAIFSPKFRQMLRIRGGKAVDGATTALEKETDQYNQLVAKLPAQRTSVAKTKANATIQQKTLDGLNTKLASLESEFKTADAAKAEASVVEAITSEYASVEAQIADQKKVVELAVSAANEAVKAYEQTARDLGKFKDRIAADGNKVDLADALKVAADARNEMRDMQSQISAAGSASAEIDKKLETARAELEMGNGSSTDQARARLQETAAANDAAARLRAKLGTAPSSTTETK